nr:unnamed protein product [Callosobruchus analis]
MDTFRRPRHVNFEELSSPFDDGKESLGCLPPDFENDLSSSTDFCFPSSDIHNSWKRFEGFIHPDFELELNKFTSNAETMKDDPHDNFNSHLTPLDYLRESLSGKESLGILQIGNLDTSFGESSLNPLSDSKDIIMRLNTAHIFNTSTGLDIWPGTQDGLIASRKSIQSNSAYLPSFTTPIYSLSKNPFKRQFEPKSSSVLRDMDDTVFKEKIECSPQEKADDTLGNISCIMKDIDMVYLDCTPQPDWPSDLESSSNENTRLKSVDVFKQIDIKVPAVLQLHNQKTSDTDIHNEENGITKLNSEASCQPKDSTPEELLQMISKILSKSNISVEQKSKGQMMILQLSEILCSTKSSGSAEECSSNYAVNDSGNASKQYSKSFEKDNYEVYEVLDLSRKRYETFKQDEFPKNPVNLSVISSDVKKLSRSLSHPNIKNKAIEKYTEGPATNVNKEKCRSVVKVNVIAPTSTSTTNLHKIHMRPNSKPSNITQKGPLKAVLPVRDMRRSK